MGKRIIFTVTNNLSFDQRMNRICTSLAHAGYDVLLVGRKTAGSSPLSPKPYRQTRLRTVFSSGKLFYASFNIQLFFYLLFKKAAVICAIDLDTILPCLFASGLKGCERVYDAHELFCEMKEVVSRPAVYRSWKRIERFSIPRFKHGYTVNQLIAGEFQSMYGVSYEVIRNMPLLNDEVMPSAREKFILYQGAVNEGRCFETLIPAMQQVNASLIICGDGNFMEQAKALVQEYGVAEKVQFRGYILPEQLPFITRQAAIGVTLFEKDGRSNYYSLANKYFDYIQAGTPQVCVDYPAYREINNLYETAVLIDTVDPAAIASALNNLLSDEQLYKRLAANCINARKELNWQQEEKKLIAFYNHLSL